MTEPMNERPVLVSWSGGKDSCVALYEVQKTRRVEALLTTITRDFDRIGPGGGRIGQLGPVDIRDAGASVAEVEMIDRHGFRPFRP